jgi:hypothetical protein
VYMPGRLGVFVCARARERVRARVRGCASAYALDYLSSSCHVLNWIPRCPPVADLVFRYGMNILDLKKQTERYSSGKAKVGKSLTAVTAACQCCPSSSFHSNNASDMGQPPHNGPSSSVPHLRKTNQTCQEDNTRVQTGIRTDDRTCGAGGGSSSCRACFRSLFFCCRWCWDTSPALRAAWPPPLRDSRSTRSCSGPSPLPFRSAALLLLVPLGICNYL